MPINELDIKTEDFEGEPYVKFSELEQELRDKKIVSKNQFMNQMEKLVGFCSVHGRIHTYLDFIINPENEAYYKCDDCGHTVHNGRWESAQTLEMFFFNDSWVEAKRQRE